MKNFFEKIDPNKYSEENVMQFLHFTESLIDNLIEERIASSDLLKVRDAKIVKIIDSNTATLICDDIYYDAKNCTGVAFTASDVGDWVKMITYDNLNYFILHKLEPDAIDVEGLKEEVKAEILNEISE